MPRRTITIIALAFMAAAMMGAEDPKCDRAKGRAPQPAEHDPKPLNPKYSTKPTDRTYHFKIQFSTGNPVSKVTYTYYFGGNGEENLEWDGPGRSYEGRYSPNTVISLAVSAHNSKTILSCQIIYISDKDPNDQRVRAQYFESEPAACILNYVVRQGEENIQ